ncbi:ABCF5 [Symbiodinium sp. CCMP2456]|nr:ABCF5 [Symbiodinium sp. CCMP2456]
MVPEGAKPKRQASRKTGTGRSGQMMIYVLTEIPAGTEIFNTYGEFSNDKLLQDYGFVLEQNAFNTVTLARSLLAPGRRFRRQLRFAAQHAAVLGLTQAGSDEEESEEGSEDAEMGPGSSQEQGLATFFELDRGPLPKALRVLLAVLSLPTSTLVRARAAPPGVLRRFLRRSSRWVLELPVARRALRAALRRRSSAAEAAELRRRWEAAEPPREKAALALRTSEQALLEHLLDRVRQRPLLSRKRRTLISQRHYTGIDGLIESVPGTLAEKRKKERKGLRKNQTAKWQQERREQLQSSFLSRRT